MMIKKRNRSSGFTLIELMISMTILAFIALAIYQNTYQSFIIRDNVERDGDFYNSIRVSLDLLGRDLAQIYSPVIYGLPEELQKSSQSQVNVLNGSGGNPAQGLAVPTEFWGDAINTQGVRASRLQGESTKLSFVTNNHVRLYKDTAESDFAKISYSLEDDKNAPRGAPGKVLMKSEDPAVFDDSGRLKSETVVRYTLMTDVKSLQFNYLDGEKDSWSTKWDTSGLEHKDKFPDIIEVIVEVYMPLVPGADPNATRSTFKIAQRYKPELPL